MAQIYDSLKSLMTPARMSKAAEVLNVDTSKVTGAVSAILPSQLAMLLKKGHTSDVKEVIEMAGKMNADKDINQFFEGSGIINDINIGERMENALTGSTNTDFAHAIASVTKIDSEHADRLSNWVAATIAAFFGQKVLKEKVSMSSLLADLGKEKSLLAKDIPAGLMSKFGLASILGASGTGSAKTKATTQKPKKKNGWIWWLLAIILVLLLIFWWKSCDNKKKVALENERARIEQLRLDSIARAEAAAKAVARPFTQITLPDGTVINVYEKGAEDGMVAYLKSAGFKTATLADLKRTGLNSTTWNSSTTAQANLWTARKHHTSWTI